MIQSNSVLHSHRPHALVGFAAALLICGVPAQAQDNGSPEHAQLAAVLRQLDAIEATANQAELSSQATAARYRFDFARLRADLARIRTGIEDYLTPRRAQPREPTPLSGNYTSESQTQ